MDISSDVANAYDSRFSPFMIRDLIEKEISSETVNAYAGAFRDRDIMRFIKEGVGSEAANKYAELNRKYGTKIDVSDIVAFEFGDIGFKEIETRAKKFALDKAFSKWNSGRR